MWMLRRSFIRKNDRNEANSCVHIKKLSVNEGTFEYDHNHKEADKWQNIYIYVTLQESTDSDSDPRINVRSAKSPSTKEYRLRYWDPQHHCAILTFIGTSNSQTECELYQWKDDIPGGIPQGCKEKFAQLCGGRKQLYEFRVRWSAIKKAASSTAHHLPSSF
uniref:Uncharacterized protein n=1 Tax=Amblyomma maculatum TaxID=34609 RepID=G3MSY3_AMBMU